MKNENSAFYSQLGRILKDARASKKISLSQLSELMQSKSKSTLKRYEDGKARIDMDTLASLCYILGLDLNETVKKASSSSNEVANPTVGELALISRLRCLSEAHRSTIIEMIDLFFKQDTNEI